MGAEKARMECSKSPTYYILGESSAACKQQSKRTKLLSKSTVISETQPCTTMLQEDFTEKCSFSVTGVGSKALAVGRVEALDLSWGPLLCHNTIHRSGAVYSPGQMF